MCDGFAIAYESDLRIVRQMKSNHIMMIRIPSLEAHKKYEIYQKTYQNIIRRISRLISDYFCKAKIKK